MKRKIKIILLTLTILIMVIIGLFMYVYFNYIIMISEGTELKFKGVPVIENYLSNDQIKEDIDYIIDIMENTHPIFLEEVPKSYYINKNKLLTLTNSNKGMTVGEFQYEVSKYLSSIQDGHTSLWWNEESSLIIDWKYVNGYLYLLDDDKKLTNEFVSKIGDINIEKILENIKVTFPAENYVAEARNVEIFSRSKLLLESTGVDFITDIKITLNDGEKERLLDMNLSDSFQNIPSSQAIYSKIIDDSIAYIRLGTCLVDSRLYKVLDEIKQYKNQGIKDYIIDVINNSGGNSNACLLLLQALDMEPATYDVLTRFSPLAQEQRGYLRKSGYVNEDLSRKAVKNDDINLYILTNEDSFSSAQMLAVWVRDSKLGKIVGRPSKNMPSNYGDVLKFQMSNSKLIGQISTRKWTRPDVSKDKEPVLEPDIYVEYGEDILQRTIDEIIGKVN